MAKTPRENSLVPKSSVSHIEYVQPEGGIIRVYANNVAIGTTPFDMRIIFGEVTDVGAETRKVTIEQNVQVTMSWAEAKLVAKFIERHVQAYEKKNGTLTTPQPAPLLPDASE